MKKRIKKIFTKKQSKAEPAKPAAAEDVPRITNDTVAAHREEVLGSARKFIYPLQHSKHKIVIISTTLFIALVVGFFSYCTIALYKLQSNSTFLYRVSQVIPFPVARTGGKFVAYENYLFELRHYVHYYETQVKLDFNDPKNKDQLEQFKKKALDKVVNDAYIKQLAAKNGVTVSDREVEDQITIVRNQNRLGNSPKVLEDVLKDYYGWSVADLKRSLRSEMLAQKLVAKLDTQAGSRANAALAELKGGADFATVAKKYSDEAETKANGGEYGFPIDKTSKDISPQVSDALFQLKPGEYSGILNTSYALNGNFTLEIVKVIEVNGDKIRAAHIVFNLKDINSYVNDLKDKQKARTYIRV